MYILNELKLVEIFCQVDDFCQLFSEWEKHHLLGEYCPKWKPALKESEIMTITIFYHLSGFKCFKYYYNRFVCENLKSHFPNLVSYNRFIELLPRVFMKMFFFTKFNCTSPAHDINFIDAAKLPVCHNLRIHSHKVFKQIAKRGKTSMGWFYGLKLHLIINDLGELVNFMITPGNVSDNNKKLLRKILKDIKGKVFGDKGYLTKLFEELYEQGIHLITKVRSNMKNALLKYEDKILLRKRALIETVFDLLKAICNIDHTRHRSPKNAMVHIFAGLAAYSFFDEKPSIYKGKQKAISFIPKIS